MPTKHHSYHHSRTNAEAGRQVYVRAGQSAVSHPPPPPAHCSSPFSIRPISQFCITLAGSAARASVLAAGVIQAFRIVWLFTFCPLARSNTLTCTDSLKLTALPARRAETIEHSSCFVFGPACLPYDHELDHNRRTLQYVWPHPLRVVLRRKRACSG